MAGFDPASARGEEGQGQRRAGGDTAGCGSTEGGEQQAAEELEPDGRGTGGAS